MFVVSVHNFKMSEQISAEYNRRMAIIENRVGHSQTKIIRFSEINCIDVAALKYGFEDEKVLPIL